MVLSNLGTKLMDEYWTLFSFSILFPHEKRLILFLFINILKPWKVHNTVTDNPRGYKTICYFLLFRCLYRNLINIYFLPRKWKTIGLYSYEKILSAKTLWKEQNFRIFSRLFLSCKKWRAIFYHDDTQTLGLSVKLCAQFRPIAFGCNRERQ